MTQLPEARTPLHGDVDFTMMYAAHDAFARDLGRFTDACQRGVALGAAVRSGWAVFERQLHTHHRAEDAALWPALRAAVLHPSEVTVLEDMEREHSVLDPYLERIDEALAAGDATAVGVAATSLAAGLTAHMAHEESAALPLVETYLGVAGWSAFVGHLRSTQGMSGAAEFLPWLLDGASTARRREVLGLLPPPVKVIYRGVWAPAWRRAHHWG